MVARSEHVPQCCAMRIISINYPVICLFIALYIYFIIAYSFHNRMDVKLYREERYLKYQSEVRTRKGPGEKGEGVQFDAAVWKYSVVQEGMNVLASDNIAVDRSLKDYR